GANQISLNSAGYTDLAGNSGVGSAQSAGFAIDTQLPTATITVSETALRTGETAVVRSVFSEAVRGLDLSDFSAPNGTLSDLRTSDGITWTATLTPNAGVQAGANQISLNNAGYTDLAGNSGVGSAQSEGFAIDTKLPTATITVNDMALQTGETAQVRIVFSEAVQGLDLADFHVANGILSNLRTSDGITWTATLTPNAGVQAGTNQISLNNAGYTDLTGNSGVGSTQSEGFAIDTQAPSATITVNAQALRAGETAQVTIVFNEAVQGLDLADFTVANGTLGDLRTLDGITWTAILTPNGAVQAGANQISLNNTGYTDLSGNAGVGETGSDSYPVVIASVPVNAAGAPSINVPVPQPVAEVSWPPMQIGSEGSDAGFVSEVHRGGLLRPLSSPLALALAGFSERSMTHPSDPVLQQDPVDMPELPWKIGAAQGPYLLRSVSDLAMGFGGRLEWKVPADIFGHTDPLASIYLSMALADGSPLPGWIRFDARNRTLTVQTPDGVHRELVLQLTARDEQGREVKTPVKLKPGAQTAARAGVAEQFQRAAMQRAGGTGGQRVHA
ncbi:MAG: Ig-like domain-containing protein, partial [Comamonas sp.]